MSASTMTVRIRDRASESPWGSGPTSPCVRTVTISSACPSCGVPRGRSGSLRQYDDGCWYTVDVWANPCGHVDMYSDVAREAAALAMDDDEDEDDDLCPDTGEHPLARCAVEGCQNYRDELEALAPAWTSGRGLKGWSE